jgi:hypothetical protein
VRAVDLVVDANGDLDLWFATSVSALEGRRGAVGRFARRAGADAAAVSSSTSVRGALVRVPADQAVTLCRSFARLQSSTVRAHLALERRRLERARAVTGSTTAELALDLVASWTGPD